MKKIIKLVIKPKKFFEEIENTEINNKKLFFSFYITIFLINTSLDLTNMLLIKENFVIENIPRISIIVIAMQLFYTVALFVFSWIIFILSRIFKAEQNKEKTLMIVLYSSIYTTFMLIFGFIPIPYSNWLGYLLLAYIRGNGIRVILKSKRNHFLYAITPELLVICILILIRLIASAVQNLFFMPV